MNGDTQKRPGQGGKLHRKVGQQSLQVWIEKTLNPGDCWKREVQESPIHREREGEADRILGFQGDKSHLRPETTEHEGKSW